MAKIVADPRWSAWNKDGTPCVGAELAVYNQGTDDKIIITSDPNGQIPATNPLVANERGLFPVFFVPATVDSVKIKITAPNGTVISQVDNLPV